MDLESEPKPVSLGAVKDLLEKELSVRENRLRCIDCGHFQPVPEVETEPATKAEESEAPAGPTCDSCGSERLNLIEQIQYEHKLALDHVRLLSRIGSKEAQEIIDKVIDLEHVDE